MTPLILKSGNKVKQKLSVVRAGMAAAFAAGLLSERRSTPPGQGRQRTKDKGEPETV
jgi:hypothetical protein